MNVERQTVTGLKWSTSAKLLTQASSWCVTLVVIRLLAPGEDLTRTLCFLIGVLRQIGSHSCRNEKSDKRQQDQ